MTEELGRLAPEIVVAAIVCAALVGLVLVVQWGRTRRHEDELDFTRRMVEQGLSVDEIERLLAKRTPPPRGLLEQFNSLSKGSKAGLIFIAFFVVVLVMSTAQSYIFWVARK